MWSTCLRPFINLFVYWVIDGQVFSFSAEGSEKKCLHHCVLWGLLSCPAADAPAKSCSCSWDVGVLFESVVDWTLVMDIFKFLSLRAIKGTGEKRIDLNYICECKHLDEKKKKSWKSCLSVLPSVPLCQVAATRISCQSKKSDCSAVIASQRKSSQPVPIKCTFPRVCEVEGKHLFLVPIVLKVTDSQTWEKLYDLTVSIFGLASCTVGLCWTHCVRCAVRARRPVKTSSRLT